MKKIIKSFVAFICILFMFSFNGCDELQSLPLNVIIPISFEKTDSNNPINVSEGFCLNESEDWRENQESIRSASYVSAAYYTEDDAVGVSTPNLTGNVTMTITGPGLFIQETINNAVIADYQGNPYVFDLSADEITALNDYLNSIQEDPQCIQKTFTATLNITITNPLQGPYTLFGRVELVIEADVEL